VTVLSVELVQRLARMRGNDRPVVTLYLNVDGKEHLRPEDFHVRLDGMVKEALAKDSRREVVEDLGQIQSFVTERFERGSTRGLAIFTCGNLLWEAVELPVPVEDHLTVNLTPHVRQLEAVLSEHAMRIGVLLTDRQRGRLLVIDFGRVVESEECFDPLPRHDDDKGDLRKDRVRDHVNAVANAHLRHAAQQMFELYQRCHFDYLVLGIAEELKPELERCLHDYLHQKVVGRTNLSPIASEEEIVTVARDLVRSKERQRASGWVEKLRAAVGTELTTPAVTTNGSASAVAGLEPTLTAVYEKRVETLLVSQGYAVEGWRCTSCDFIATVGRRCRMCGSEMHLVEDVVEEAIEDALGQNCRVEFCDDNADLDVLGRIGALLRF
jgi:peptide subunit release factor 1 (eRF1)